MLWDDEFDSDYDDGMNESSYHQTMPEQGTAEDLDPFDLKNPASAYLFLSDDAQDEITGSNKKKMKCLSCGHVFMGEVYDYCPECFSSDTDEAVTEADDKTDTFY